MVREVMHIGVTVSDMDRSIAFYRDVLGLKFEGELLMEGRETELLFARPGCRARVAYLNGSGELAAPPIELIQFLDRPADKFPAALERTSISEICFRTPDIDRLYAHLQQKGVPCLSPPQAFDFTASGFGKSRAIYFRDPDGIVLEAMQPVGE